GSTTPRTSATCRSWRAWRNEPLTAPNAYNVRSMPDRLPPPAPKSSWARLSKTVAFWLLVILAPFVFIQLAMRRSADYVEIKSSAFVAALERGNIREVVVEDLQDVRGEFKSPEHVDGRDIVHFTVPLPFPSSEAFAQKLHDAGVPISAKKARQGLFSVFV